MFCWSTSCQALARALLLLSVASCWSCERDEAPAADPTLSAKERRDETKPQKTPPTPVPRRNEAVTYTVARGGTLLEVANLYKIEHHEIRELNPEIAPEQELPPATEVVVYVPRGRASESIGLPHAGQVEGAMPMPNGPGRRITAERWKTWATHSTVKQLDRALRRWASEHPSWPPVLVGNLSARYGGALKPHKSHQSGRDVDLGYISKDATTETSKWQKMNAANLDCEKTWALLKTLIRETSVEVIYADRKVQRLLLRCANKSGQVRAEQLRAWLEVAPRARRGSTLFRHAANHEDHFHVRFTCPDTERRCRS